MTKTAEHVDRETILKAIAGEFQQMMQWSGHSEWLHHVPFHRARAEALIELLEASDCGSHGGFDAGQPRAVDLFDRWDWLVKKSHPFPGNYEWSRCVTYKDIRDWFLGFPMRQGPAGVTP